MNKYDNLLLSTKKYKLMRDFWLKKLSGIDSDSLFMPTLVEGCDAKAIRTEVRFVLPVELAQKVIKLSQNSDLAVYVVLLTGFKCLLYRLTDKNDLLVAGPIYKDIDQEVSYNQLLPFRTIITEEQTFTDLLKMIRKTVLDSYDNQEYPLEVIMDEFHQVVDQRYDHFLTDIVLDFENINNELLRFDQKPGLFISVSRKDDIITLHMDVDKRRLNPEILDNIPKYYTTILQSCLANLNQKIINLDILSFEEKSLLLETFNSTQRDYPENLTIHNVFETHCHATPDKIAIVYKERELTYAEINAKANQLACYLGSKGIKPNQVVGIIAHRSPEMIIGILAILKAGAAYLPISPQYPPERISYMLNDSQVSFMLTEKDLKHYSNYCESIECLVLDDFDLFQGESANLAKANNSQNIAYVIYTSGSTGRPKGSIITHKNVINILYTWHEDYPIGENDAYLFKTPLIFDFSVIEIFTWFMDNGKLVILPDGIESDPKSIYKTVKRHGVTHINFVPSMLSAFIWGLTRDNLQELTSLKYLFTGGEEIPYNLAKQVKALLPAVTFTNLYGPTEATICATRHLITDCEKGPQVSIGKPLPNVKVYILDAHNNLQPQGLVGELCIGGIGVGLGYLNRPELTEAKFVPNPFDPGTLMYRTGDLGCWLSNGVIQFSGRKDHQVKIRGYRIELGEIEAHLLKHPKIESAVVMERNDLSGEKCLCAYIASQQEISLEEVKAKLAINLPEYMIPAYFIHLSELPLMFNGKVDHKALLHIGEDFLSDTEYVAPRDEVEAKLADIWTSILGIDKIGIEDNFFNIGGQSLKATQMATYIFKDFNVEIPLTEIFRMPTIKSLAEYIKQAEKTIYYSIEKAPVREYYPTSSAQKRIYFLSQIRGNETSYNMTEVMEFEGDLDLEKLNQIFRCLVNRHESFRTYFDIVDGEIVQRVAEYVEFKISFNIINELEINKVIDDFIRPFNLHEAPLLRVNVAQYSDSNYLLMIDIHHSIADGVSMGVLLKEFLLLYEGKELPELPIQYKDFAMWQNNLLHSEQVARQEEYWLSTFSGEIHSLQLPTDFSSQRR